MHEKVKSTLLYAKNGSKKFFFSIFFLRMYEYVTEIKRLKKVHPFSLLLVKLQV